MVFSRQENWSGLPFPSLWNLPDPEIEPESPALQADSLPSELPGKPVSYSLDVPSLPQTLRACDYQNRTPFSGVSIMCLFSRFNAQVANLSNLPS